MTLTIHISRETQKRLEEIAAENGQRPADYVRHLVEQSVDGPKLSEEPSPLRQVVSEMTHRTPEQIAQAQARAMQTYLPRRPVPPGKTLAEIVSGQWPGQETDEQIKAALDDLS
jgi:hypothetical protein